MQRVRARDRAREVERRDRELVLAVDTKRVTAGHEHSECGARVEQLPHDRGGAGDLLEIVHEQERRPTRVQVLAQDAHEGAIAALGHTKRARDGRGDEIRVGDRRQVDERRSALEATVRDRRPPGWPVASFRYRPRL